MTRDKRPAAYIRVARDCAAVALVAQRTALCLAARAHGWSEPAVYFDIDDPDSPRGARPALARLTVAINTGQHDALLLDIGTVCSTQPYLTSLLSGCTRHGVAVECVSRQQAWQEGAG